MLLLHAQKPTQMSSHEYVFDHFSHIMVKSTARQVHRYIQLAQNDLNRFTCVITYMCTWESSHLALVWTYQWMA